ncbi:uncharacterized protein LOC144750196 [Ciona intestinalis]
MKEMTTYKAFLDFTDCCWNDDLFPLEFQKLMKFLTGSSTLPPLGLPNDLSISFLHGCRLSPGGTKCRCLPTVSTCAISVGPASSYRNARGNVECLSVCYHV